MNETSHTHPNLLHRARVPLTKLRQAVEVALDNWIPNPSGATVVDIGCGDSPYRKMFEAKGMKYIACDLGEPADVVFEPNKPIPLPDNSADVVVSFQVLEHVWELDWYLGECRRILKPGGKFIVSTHGVWLYHPHPGDYRRWTCMGLQRELGDHGLPVKKIEGMVGPLAWTTQFRLFGYYTVSQKVPVLGAILLAPVALFMNLRMYLEEAITPKQMKFDHASMYICLCEKGTPIP